MHPSAHVDIDFDEPVSRDRSSSNVGLCPTINAQELESGNCRTRLIISEQEAPYMESSNCISIAGATAAITACTVARARAAGELITRSGIGPRRDSAFPIFGASL